MCKPAASGRSVVQAWYDGINNPGYDFTKGVFSSGTGHFTQVVWVGTTHVGAARSKDGICVVHHQHQCCFLEFCTQVANYSPPGNRTGTFKQNVLPPNSSIETPMSPRSVTRIAALCLFACAVLTLRSSCVWCTQVARLSSVNLHHLCH